MTFLSPPFACVLVGKLCGSLEQATRVQEKQNIVGQTEQHSIQGVARRAIEARWKKAQQPLTDITNTSPPLGSRILDLENLGSGLAEISTHSGQCGGMCVLDGETRQAGLASVLTVKCIKCGSKFRIESSKRVKAADGHQRWVVNVAAVFGQMLSDTHECSRNA